MNKVVRLRIWVLPCLASLISTRFSVGLGVIDGFIFGINAYLGPNVATGHASVIFSQEAQVIV